MPPKRFSAPRLLVPDYLVYSIFPRSPNQNVDTTSVDDDGTASQAKVRFFTESTLYVKYICTCAEEAHPGTHHFHTRPCLPASRGAIPSQPHLFLQPPQRRPHPRIRRPRYPQKPDVASTTKTRHLRRASLVTAVETISSSKGLGRHGARSPALMPPRALGLGVVRADVRVASDLRRLVGRGTRASHRREHRYHLRSCKPGTCPASAPGLATAFSRRKETTIVLSRRRHGFARSERTVSSYSVSSVASLHPPVDRQVQAHRYRRSRQAAEPEVQPTLPRSDRR